MMTGWYAMQLIIVQKGHAIQTSMLCKGHACAGMNQISEKQLNDAEKQFKVFESMINSMTPQERSNPDLLAKVGTQAQLSLLKHLRFATLMISQTGSCVSVRMNGWREAPMLQDKFLLIMWLLQR